MTTQRSRALVQQRLTRRAAVGAGGLGAAAVLGGGGVKEAAGQVATAAARKEAGPLRPLLSDNPMWDEFGNRALDYALNKALSVHA